MRSEGYSNRAVRLSVCLSVCYRYSGTTSYKAAKERYRRLQCYLGMDFKKAIFLKLLRSKVMASFAYLGSGWLLYGALSQRVDGGF